jgi:hypothetical protein
MHKTFITETEATKYRDELRAQGNLATLCGFGEKFRVYVETKENIKQIQEWSGDKFTLNDVKYQLSDRAWHEGNEVNQALTLRKMIVDNSIYNDYESLIEAVRIVTTLLAKANSFLGHARSILPRYVPNTPSER